jgi:N-acetylglucosaminyl-diphospho-decaprenol L-rhamnosyltransferase
MPGTSNRHNDAGVDAADLFGAVIVAHARVDLACRCVETLLRSVRPENVVVVINAPALVKDPNDVAALARQVKVVSPSEPQGYGANLNLGIRSLPPQLDFVLLSNDDVEFSHEWLRQVYGHFLASPQVGAVGFTLRDAAGAPLASTGEFPTVLDALIRSVAYPSWMKRFVQRVDGRLQKTRRLARRMAAHEGVVDWVIGAAMVVRRDAFLQIGGFDERFFLYFEETDLCDRLWTHGWFVLTATNASVVHLQRQSTGRAEYRAVFREARRTYLLKRLGLTRWLLLELLFPFALGVSLVTLVGALVKPSTFSDRVRAMRHSWSRRAFLLPLRRPRRDGPLPQPERGQLT